MSFCTNRLRLEKRRYVSPFAEFGASPTAQGELALLLVPASVGRVPALSGKMLDSGLQ